MQLIKPYESLSNARTALDNGGRFYNLLTRREDNVITSPELAKAAGIFAASAEAFLFFEMALADLSPSEQGEVTSMLSPDLQKDYAAHRALILAPSRVEADGENGKSAIVSGYTHFIEDRTQFKGFVIIPVMIGKNTSIIPMPITDKFDVYEVFDTPTMDLPHTVIATLRGSKRIKDGSYLRFGGILKELSFKDPTPNPHQRYLDTLYYTPLS